MSYNTIVVQFIKKKGNKNYKKKKKKSESINTYFPVIITLKNNVGFVIMSGKTGVNHSAKIRPILEANLSDNFELTKKIT